LLVDDSATPATSSRRSKEQSKVGNTDKSYCSSLILVRKFKLAFDSIGQNMKTIFHMRPDEALVKSYI